jgi:hypothetical protein
MLQLSKGLATNIVAFYPDIPISSSATQIRFSGSQDYDRSSSVFDAVVTSNVDETPYVIAEFSGSLLPSASGLFSYDVFELELGAPLVWNLATTQWQLTTAIWNTATGIVVGDKLVSLRAFNSGSDVPVFTQYESPNENGAYITYLG